ncbi:YheC/YheD family protein [Heyndrickxia sporothermodurans]
MKTSRGRLGQYNILKTEESLSKHLLKTELFSKKTLFNYLNMYKTIFIKPVFGPGKITVSSANGKFIINSVTSLTTALNAEETYQYLIHNELNQKYYVIQPTKLNASFFQSQFQYFITFHRKSASENWSCISRAEKSLSTFGNYYYTSFHRKMENLAILAAKKLGEAFPDCNTIVFDIVYDLRGGIWIQDSVLHFPISKWSQYHALTANHSLKSFVPNTALLTKGTLYNFLTKYKEIIIKPCLGQRGIGIVQISTNNHLSYEIHSGRTKFTTSTFEETFHFIEKHFLSKKYYIVQQKLLLATINDCPMDVRVITQKVDSTWKVTGKIVKVAGNNFIITNAAQKLLFLEDAIQNSNIPHINFQKLEDKIDELCISAAIQLEEHNAKITIVGFDIGITQQGSVWIIEGNYIPDLSMFNKLSDKGIYRNIINNKKNKSDFL